MITESRGMFGYVYETKNLINSKFYIGLKKGKQNLKYLGSGDLILEAIKQYGRKSFSVRVLRFCSTKEELGAFEEQMISEYRKKYGKENVYNIHKGGYNWYAGMTGHKHTEASKQLISSSLRGKTAWNKGIPCAETTKEKLRLSTQKVWESPEYRQKMTLLRRGVKKSPEFCANLSRVMKGRVVSETWRNNMSLARKGKPGKPWSEERLQKGKASMKSYWKSLSTESRNERCKKISEGKLKGAAERRRVSGRSYSLR